MTLAARDHARLAGLHPDLHRVVLRADEVGAIRFTVLEGLRTIERQKLLLAQGATTTLRSRHLTGHAVDLAPLDAQGKPSWHWPHYNRLAPVIKAAAEEMEVAITWGGDWKKFRDGPHFELSWKVYPA